jgi:putative ABC transport system permease protein
VLAREGNKITANASVVQYNEITGENIDSFHFHGGVEENPVTAVIALPPDQKSSAMLQGRYQAEELTSQIVRPVVVMEELLDTILTVQNFVVAGAVAVGIATLATTVLVFLLSLRLRRREIETLIKIGGSRSVVGSLMVSEIVAVLVTSVALAGGLTFFTAQFGSLVIRTVIRS